jgi:hypothetical protein
MFALKVVLRANRINLSKEEQSLIEGLYFDLKSLNPDLAQRTLQYAIIYLEKIYKQEDLTEKKENNLASELTIRNHSKTKNIKTAHKQNKRKIIKKCKKHKSFNQKFRA